jgi:glycosyltransferase involved in cell wall biosynthesis
VPDVSVIIPCFRCSATVTRSVASALAQSEPPLEVILVDDASPDGTAEVLDALVARHGERLRVISLPRNGGAAAARNAGWDAARGELVAFLDADDTWHPRKLEIQRGFMRGRPEYPMTAHWMAYEDDPTRFELAGEQVPFTEIAFRSMLYRNWFHTSSVMLRRDVPQRFAPDKRHGEDRQLWLDIAAAGRRIARIDLPLVTIYKPLFGVSGLSADLWAMEAAELATFRGLRRAGLIGTPLLCALLTWSLARFLRRLVLVAVGRRIRPAQ